MPTAGLVEGDVAGRTVEPGVAEGEDAAVGRVQPVAPAAAGGGHAHDRLVEGDAPGRSVEPGVAEGEDAAVRRVPASSRGTRRVTRRLRVAGHTDAPLQTGPGQPHRCSRRVDGLAVERDHKLRKGIAVGQSELDQVESIRTRCRFWVDTPEIGAPTRILEADRSRLIRVAGRDQDLQRDPTGGDAFPGRLHDAVGLDPERARRAGPSGDGVEVLDLPRSVVGVHPDALGSLRIIVHRVELGETVERLGKVRTGQRRGVVVAVDPVGHPVGDVDPGSPDERRTVAVPGPPDEARHPPGRGHSLTAQIEARITGDGQADADGGAGRAQHRERCAAGAGHGHRPGPTACRLGGAVEAGQLIARGLDDLGDDVRSHRGNREGGRKGGDRLGSGGQPERLAGARGMGGEIEAEQLVPRPGDGPRDLVQRIPIAAHLERGPTVRRLNPD